MKKILLLLLALAMLFSVCACESESQQPSTSSGTSSTNSKDNSSISIQISSTEECEHNWKEATCTEPKTCTDCEKTDGKPLDHSYNSDLVCIRCGETSPILADTLEVSERIKIYGTFLEMNSVSGVDVYITWENKSDKEIKYITFTTQLYNKVNDPISCDIRNKFATNLKQTGPIPKNKGNYITAHTGPNGYKTIFKGKSVTFEEADEDMDNGWAEQCWENVWYNSTAYYTKITGVSIEYMDGAIFSCKDPLVFERLGIINLNIDQYHNDYA